jgi:hypothetical protein
MSCTSCGSENLRKFKGEVAIWHSWSSAVDSTLMVWAELVICLACGAAHFPVPRAELSILAKDTPTAGFWQD